MAVNVSVAVVCPVPDTFTGCGLPLALSVTLSVPEREPSPVGVKVTLIEQFAPAATVDPQVFVSLKSLAFVPAIVMLETLRVALPELLSVTPCAALELPTFCGLNDKEGDDRLASGWEGGGGGVLFPPQATQARSEVVATPSMIAAPLQPIPPPCLLRANESIASPIRLSMPPASKPSKRSGCWGGAGVVQLLGATKLLLETLTLTAAVTAIPFGVTFAGLTEHTDPTGAPAHASDTALANPLTGVKVNV